MRGSRLLAAAALSVAFAGASIGGAAPAMAATNVECVQGGGTVAIVVKFHNSYSVCHGGTYDGQQVFVVQQSHHNSAPTVINIGH